LLRNESDCAVADHTAFITRGIPGIRIFQENRLKSFRVLREEHGNPHAAWAAEKSFSLRDIFGVKGLQCCVEILHFSGQNSIEVFFVSGRGIGISWIMGHVRTRDDQSFIIQERRKDPGEFSCELRRITAEEDGDDLEILEDPLKKWQLHLEDVISLVGVGPVDYDRVCGQKFFGKGLIDRDKTKGRFESAFGVDRDAVEGMAVAIADQDYSLDVAAFQFFIRIGRNRSRINITGMRYHDRADGFHDLGGISLAKERVHVFCQGRLVSGIKSAGHGRFADRFVLSFFLPA